MVQRSKLIAAALGTGVIGLLAACATSTIPSATEAMAKTATKVSADERETITGSRIPAKTTDRLVQQVDAADAQEADRSRPPSPGPRVN